MAMWQFETVNGSTEVEADLLTDLDGFIYAFLASEEVFMAQKNTLIYAKRKPSPR